MSADVQIHDQRLRGREVRWIELTRAAKSNALSVALLRQATDAVTEAPERAIFVSSRGRTFSAGLDLEEMLELGSAARPRRARAALYDALVKHPSPTACLVEHKAVAGGIGLALCADAVVMSCHAWFRLPAEHLYRPLAEVLLPIVQARRGITEPEFARWYGTKRTAAELAAGGHIDRVLHGDASRSMTGRLKRAAVDVLIDK